MPVSAGPRGFLASAFIALTLAVPVLRTDAAPVVAKTKTSAAVTVTDNGYWRCPGSAFVFLTMSCRQIHRHSTDSKFTPW